MLYIVDTHHSLTPWTTNHDLILATNKLKATVLALTFSLDFELKIIFNYV